MKITLDHYAIQARLLPIFLLLLPIGLVFISWFPATSIWLGALETIGVPIVLTALFSQLGRDLGKKKEGDLLIKWGGMPTDRILSLHYSPLDRITLNRYRTKLSVLIPDVHFLDTKQESEQPELALQVFRSSTNFLREKTRSREHFPLISAENMNYGFRRNLWAMKPAGILISLLGIIGSTPSILLTQNYSVALVAVALNVFLLVFWIFRIKPSWVKIPAEEYARQLFAACEIL